MNSLLILKVIYSRKKNYDFNQVFFSAEEIHRIIGKCTPVYRGRILGRNWEKSLRSFPHSHLYKQILLPPPPSKSGVKLVCNIKIVYGNLKSENSQDYAQKPQRNHTSMNPASALVLKR
jgi:hypothetical protein